MTSTWDAICIGGGAVGLSIARELSVKGMRVALLDKGEPGQEASWAGAGILSPAFSRTAKTVYDLLRARSFERFPSLAEELHDETGIDPEYHRTGGIEVAFDEEERHYLAKASEDWEAFDIPFESLSRARLEGIDPQLKHLPLATYRFPDYSQVRNPRLLRSLRASCQRRGVDFFPGHAMEDFLREGDVVRGVRSTKADFRAEHIILCAGAWSRGLLQRLGFEIPVRPILGQIVALKTSPGLVPHIVLVGHRYLVPRQDGTLLVGSTEEDVGFEKRVTEEGILGLLGFARDLYPALQDAPIVAQWAGLRPGSPLGSPLICRVATAGNLWLATGHYREGLQLSPGTAELVSSWVAGERTFASPTEFSLEADRTGFGRPFRS